MARRALHWASYRDDLKSADLLIRAGANVNAANDLGATPLWTASQNGSAAMVRPAVGGRSESERGAPARRDAGDGRRPLGQSRVVEQLLAKGANVNAHAHAARRRSCGPSRRSTPMSSRCCSRTAPTSLPARRSGAEVMAVPPHGLLEYNRSIPHGGDTALMFAARVGDLARRSCSWPPAPT